MKIKNYWDLRSFLYFFPFTLACSSFQLIHFHLFYLLVQNLFHFYSGYNNFFPLYFHHRVFCLFRFYLCEAHQISFYLLTPLNQSKIIYYSQHLQFFYLSIHFLIQCFPYHHFRSGLPLFIKYLSFLIFLSIDQKISFIKFPLPSLLLLLLRHSPQIHSSHLIHLFIIFHFLNRYLFAFSNSLDAAAGLLKRLEVSS